MERIGTCSKKPGNNTEQFKNFLLILDIPWWLTRLLLSREKLQKQGH